MRPPGFRRWIRCRSTGRAYFAVAAAFGYFFCSGCTSLRDRACWNNGERRYVNLIQEAEVAPRVACSISTPRDIDPAALELARQAAKLEAIGDPACVDLYFAAAVRQWRLLAALGDRPTSDDLKFRARTYNAELAKLLSTAQRFGRFDPSIGLHVNVDGQAVAIPVAFHGFAWSPDDFNAWDLVGDYKMAPYIKKYQSEGVGAPLVVFRKRCEKERFFRRVQPFAATAVLRTRGCCESTEMPDDAIAACDNPANDLVLEFYEPGSRAHLAGADPRWTLARDLTAPLAWTSVADPNSPITAFLRPDDADAAAQLVMMEPYQPGKIPVVFVHGIASDPTTWITLINSLRSQEGFRKNYQAWFFRYPSGTPFLATAATLRRELGAAVASWPGAADDPAMRQMVLIGHSMGGLIAKLQVTESGTDIWDLVADRPLEAINADEADREQIREVFFFAPLPFVRRVVFLGTPHNGSSIASRGVGRLSSLASSTASDAEERHRRVVRDNPGVFKPMVARRVPTSVDLLEPNHPLLIVMQRMDVAPCVRLHSIIGVADYAGLRGPGDGVVLLESASQARVASEKLVSETHADLHEAATTSIEIERILRRHLWE